MIEEICKTLILSVIGLYAFLNGFDFIVFVIKHAPKSSIFGKKSWIISFIFTVILLTIYIV